MIRILDLDLDFFVHDIVYHREPDAPRPDGNEYRPWSTDAVLAYLERQVGLSPQTRVPGVAVEYHGELFAIWRHLIQREQVETPFELVHIDAHADLGLGDSGYRYLMTELMHRPQCDRWHPPYEAGKLGDGNFLAFAAACGWLRTLEYVHHPVCGDDYLRFFMRGMDLHSGFLELKAVTEADFDSMLFDETHKISPVRADPPIPFRQTPGPNFWNDQPFDLMCLCRSPAFAPAALDEVYQLIADRYMSVLVLEE